MLNPANMAQTIDGATLGSKIGNSAVGISKASNAYDKLDVAIKKAAESAKKQAEADGIAASSIVGAQTRAGAAFEKSQGLAKLGLATFWDMRCTAVALPLKRIPSQPPAKVEKSHPARENPFKVYRRAQQTRAYQRA